MFSNSRQRPIGYILTGHFENDIARVQAGALGWRTVNGRHDNDVGSFYLDLNANAFELAVLQSLEVLDHGRGQKRAVARISQGIDHPANRAIIQLVGLQRGPIDILALDRAPGLGQ